MEVEGKRYRNIGRKFCPVLQKKGAPCELTSAPARSWGDLRISPAVNGA